MVMALCKSWKTTPKLNLVSGFVCVLNLYVCFRVCWEQQKSVNWDLFTWSCMTTYLFIFFYVFYLFMCVCRRWFVVGRSWMIAWRMSSTFVAWTLDCLSFSWSATLWWRSATRAYHRYTHNDSGLPKEVSLRWIIVNLIREAIKPYRSQIVFMSAAVKWLSHFTTRVGLTGPLQWYFWCFRLR